MMENMNNITSNQVSLSHIYSLHNQMDEKNIILSYCGEFSQDLNKTLLSFTERKFKADNVEDNTRRKIFNIMVEMLQNISKNKIENAPESPDFLPLFMLGTVENSYILITSNLILNEKIQPLRDRIDQVNSLDKEGLKQLYKDVRLSGSFSEASGAGIGIIDIARKSENVLKYSFDEIDSKFSMFSLLITVSNQ
jgi:hypothetical protein